MLAIMREDEESKRLELSKKAVSFFFELLMKTRSFSSARLLGVDRFWGFVKEDV